MATSLLADGTTRTVCPSSWQRAGTQWCSRPRVKVRWTSTQVRVPYRPCPDDSSYRPVTGATPQPQGFRRSGDLRDRRPEDRTDGIGGAPGGV